MTTAVQTLGGPVRADARAPAPLLPLVSVIIVNYNYGRFLDQAIASVFAQTYPRIECIVVDNGSTDGSAAVIARNQGIYPGLESLMRSANDGQTAASCDGLKASKGPYVIFLDADDYLLPHCVERHMQVHLSSRIHVGITCGDMLQMIDDQVVTSTAESMSTFIRGGAEQPRELLRPTQAALGRLFDTVDPDLSRRVHFVQRTQQAWVWSPTSGNCFRRDALNLFFQREDLWTLRSQTDLYLAVGINAITGSILIDEPLFAYRIHGTNVFSSRAQLNGLLTFDPSRTSKNAQVARGLMIDQFVGQAQLFVQEPWQACELLQVLRGLDFSDAEHDGPRWARRSCLARALTVHLSKAVQTFGRRRTARAMVSAGVPAYTTLKLLWRHSRTKATSPAASPISVESRDGRKVHD